MRAVSPRATLTGSGSICRMTFSHGGPGCIRRGHRGFWRWSLALIVFAITLFVSAFLLFLVQPMIGKMILPKLGGTPSVWNTCMVFFQSALLAGYAYTHNLSTRVPLRKQLLIHCGLLAVPLLVLLPFGGPFNIESW